MQKHTNRSIVAAVLMAAGVLGGFFVFAAHRRVAAMDASADQVQRRIDRMIAIAGDIAAAQHAYVAPGQPDQPWLERGAMLLQQFGQEAAAIRPLLQSTDAPPALQAADKHFKSIVVMDGKVRGEIEQGQNLLAADLIFSDGRDTVAMLVATLRGLADAERETSAAQRAAVEMQQWGGLGAVAALWVVGLLALARVPGSGIEDPGSVNFARLQPTHLEPPNLEFSNRPAPATVDLAAAAEVCAALAKATDTAALREALARAADALDARGIIVWMGAGEELFPALAHGYEERVIERLGPIPRSASNATAEAWRTAQMRTVPSDVMSHGAVAAPVTGVTGCIGVFAAELRHGREDDPGTRAVAAIIAAQLAGVVSAWPSGSSEHAHKTA